MSQHGVTVTWTRESEDFNYKTYNREHKWAFDGGIVVRASATPEFLGQPDCVDPEEAFVAALASCHMLFVLAIAAKKRLIIDDYTDAATGTLEKGPDGKTAITHVTLRPKITFSGPNQPTADGLAEIHEQAHQGCFIANSVRTEVTVEPV